MDKLTAGWAPGHITGFFSSSVKDPDPKKTGSTGAGFSLAQGMTTNIDIAKHDCFFLNGQPLENPVVSATVLQLFHRKFPTSLPNFRIDHQTELIPGSGLGTSGAGAFSLALSLNQFLGNALDDTKCAQIAHEAEILCGTGLGTVLADTCGGFEIRTKAGAPGIGQVREFKADSLSAVIAVLGPLSTKNLLSDINNNLTREFTDNLLLEFQKQPTHECFLSLANDFSHKLNLYSINLLSLKNSLEQQNLIVPMLMFGEGLYTICKNEDTGHVGEAFKHGLVQTGNSKGSVIISRLSDTGARLLGV